MGKQRKRKKWHMERLQYAQWTDEIKSNLILVAYSMSNNGNVCGYYQFRDSGIPSIYHWMNDSEQKVFFKNPNVPKVDNIQEFAQKFLLN